jgi:hypothetical protein
VPPVAGRPLDVLNFLVGEEEGVVSCIHFISWMQFVISSPMWRVSVMIMASPFREFFPVGSANFSIRSPLQENRMRECHFFFRKG